MNANYATGLSATLLISGTAWSGTRTNFVLSNRVGL